MAVEDWHARRISSSSNTSHGPQANPPFVYVWGVPNVPKRIAGLQPLSEELAAYLSRRTTT